MNAGIGMHAMGKLAHGWYISNCFAYICWAIGLQVIVRVFVALLSAIQLSQTRPGFRNEGFWVYFYYCLKGIHPNDDQGRYSDYGLPAILGLIELLSYPVLIGVDGSTAIGAWIGLKTATQFRRWIEIRGTYNRFLIGNAIVVLFSVFLARQYVVTP